MGKREEKVILPVTFQDTGMEATDTKFPKQTRFIIGNEACERFSFYGMKSLLMLFMTSQLMMVKDDATSIMHAFLAAIYIMPLVGGWISDRFWGRYNTILWVSLCYCLGHAVLAFIEFTTDVGTKQIILFTGMSLIALGAGGIKPCVSAFMGDQFKPEQKSLLPKAYAAFYWSVNLGSCAAFIIIPYLREEFGYGWAFGVPGIAMGVATFVFWSGRKKYVRVPPQGRQKRDSLLLVWWHCWKERKKYGQFWDAGYARFSRESVDNTRSIVRILKIFILVPPFWALFDQTGSSWLMQGHAMESFTIFGRTIQPEQLQTANPVFVMILIPFLTMVVYPRVKWLSNPLRRMSAGMLVSAFAFGIVAALQWFLEGGISLSLLWQLLPYLVLTLAEVLISTTGLEFAFTQAPASMKSVVTSFWNLTISAGNLIVVAITEWFSEAGKDNSIDSTRFLLYGGMTFVVAFLFMWRASKYQKDKDQAEMQS